MASLVPSTNAKLSRPFLISIDTTTQHHFDLCQLILNVLAVFSEKFENMPWPFCPSCRSTLKVDSSGSISCNCCPYVSNLDELTASEIPVTVTYSATRATPLWAKTDFEQFSLRQNTEPTRATIEEPCPNCGTPEVGYYTVQLRSVDEGQTVFYECPACKHTWSINN